jgi:hypothetical protein
MMYLDDLINNVCTYRGRDRAIFRDGFRYAVAWFFLHERQRHEMDIAAINEDLDKIDTAVDVSLVGEFIKIKGDKDG